MTDKSVTHQDRRRKRAPIVFQVLLYSYLLGLFLLQLYMKHVNHW